MYSEKTKANIDWKFKKTVITETEFMEMVRGNEELFKFSKERFELIDLENFDLASRYINKVGLAHYAVRRYPEDTGFKFAYVNQQAIGEYRKILAPINRQELINFYESRIRELTPDFYEYVSHSKVVGNLREVDLQAFADIIVPMRLAVTKIS